MRHNAITLIIFIINYALLVISYAAAQSITTNNSGLFPTIEKNLSLNFPTDHGSHPDYKIEWWYLTANLEDEFSNPLGVQWTLFRAALEPSNNKTKWDNSQIWMGHAALTTQKYHFFDEKIARGGISQANVRNEPFEAYIDDWYLKGSDWKNLTVSATSKNFKYYLKLKAKGPIIKHGKDGRSVKSDSGQASAYYSQPFFQAEGWVEQNGNRLNVSGTAWADHEWSSQFIAESQDGWDWFSLNFDSGEKLMLFQVRERIKPNYYSGTWIDAEGVNKPVDPSQIVLQSLNTKNSLDYITDWKIKIKNLNLDITIKALNSSSRMNTLYPYWEGPISIEGTHSGNGYLEMTGYKD